MIWIPFVGTLALLWAALLRLGPDALSTLPGLAELPEAPLGLAACAAVGGFAGLVAVHNRRFTAGRVIGTLIGVLTIFLTLALFQVALGAAESSRSARLLGWLAERPAFAAFGAHGAALTGAFLILGMDHHGRTAALIGVAVTWISTAAAMAMPFMGLAGGPLPMLPVLVLLTAMVRMGDLETLEDAFLIPGAITSLVALAAVMLTQPAPGAPPLPGALAQAIMHGALWAMAPFVLAAALVIRLKPAPRLGLSAAGLLGVLLVLTSALTLGAGVERAAPGARPNLITPGVAGPAAFALPLALLIVLIVLAARRHRRARRPGKIMRSARKAAAPVPEHPAPQG
ncbi:MAG: hypothetical protein CSA65_06195 [Proteobacteria bacterium]|nr:MAG: hypothetical protein CSA65_06195 [Pseudomonadota bacterium]